MSQRQVWICDHCGTEFPHGIWKVVWYQPPAPGTTTKRFERSEDWCDECRAWLKETIRENLKPGDA